MFAQPSDKVRLFVVMSIRHRDMYLLELESPSVKLENNVGD